MAKNPNNEQLLMLHNRLVDGDRTVTEEIASILLSPITQAVARRFPRTDEQVIWDGVIDAIFDYFDKPHQFDLTRGVPLSGYIKSISEHKVMNLIRSETRLKEREARYEALNLRLSVELDPSAENIQKESLSEHKLQVRELFNLLDNPTDQKVLELKLRGERATKAYADVLGLSHLPKEAQRKEVKRVKDRIDKKLQRAKGVY